MHCQEICHRSVSTESLGVKSKANGCDILDSWAFEAVLFQRWKGEREGKPAERKGGLV